MGGVRTLLQPARAHNVCGSLSAFFIVVIVVQKWEFQNTCVSLRKIKIRYSSVANVLDFCAANLV